MSALVFPSHISLDAGARERLVIGLDRTLASLLDLRSQAKHAHWNVKGAWFASRHELFDRLAAHLDEWADDVAERCAALGGVAHGTVRAIHGATELPAYDERAIEAEEHVRALLERYSALSASLRGRARECAEAGDPVTEDLYVEVLRGLELDLWFLESHHLRAATAR